MITLQGLNGAKMSMSFSDIEKNQGAPPTYDATDNGMSHSFITEPFAVFQ